MMDRIAEPLGWVLFFAGLLLIALALALNVAAVAIPGAIVTVLAALILAGVMLRRAKP